jgi:hypothetical protein
MGGAKISFVPEMISTGAFIFSIDSPVKMGVLTGFTAITALMRGSEKSLCCTTWPGAWHCQRMAGLNST